MSELRLFTLAGAPVAVDYTLDAGLLPLQITIFQTLLLRSAQSHDLGFLRSTLAQIILGIIQHKKCIQSVQGKMLPISMTSLSLSRYRMQS